MLTPLLNVNMKTTEVESDQRKYHDGTMDKSLSKQQVCVTDGSRLCCGKNWTHTPGASGSYSRQVGSLSDKSSSV